MVIHTAGILQCEVSYVCVCVHMRNSVGSRCILRRGRQSALNIWTVTQTSTTGPRQRTAKQLWLQAVQSHLIETRPHLAPVQSSTHFFKGLLQHPPPFTWVDGILFQLTPLYTATQKLQFVEASSEHFSSEVSTCNPPTLKGKLLLNLFWGSYTVIKFGPHGRWWASALPFHGTEAWASWVWPQLTVKQCCNLPVGWLLWGCLFCGR